MSTNFQQNTPDNAIQHSCGASAERTARESALPMHCTPFPPPPRPASRLLASPKVTVHTKSTHYKRSRKAPGEKPQAPPAAEFKLAGPTAAAALRSPARRRIRTGRLLLSQATFDICYGFWRFARAKRQSGPLKNSAHFGILVKNKVARKPR